MYEVYTEPLVKLYTDFKVLSKYTVSLCPLHMSISRHILAGTINCVSCSSERIRFLHKETYVQDLNCELIEICFGKILNLKNATRNSGPHFMRKHTFYVHKMTIRKTSYF